MIAAIPDPELVERVKRGDLDAFEALTNSYGYRICNIALRMLRPEQDAEDLLA